MQFIPFNSRDSKHKSVFGSITAGTSLRFSVLMPRSFSCSAVTLVLHKDGCKETEYGLYWCGMEADSEEWWGTDRSFDEAGLYFYHFRYQTPSGTGNIFLRSSGCGEFAPAGKEWQQTVSKADFKTPGWVKGGIMYQIFPDRFFFSGEEKQNVPADRSFHRDLTEAPLPAIRKNQKPSNDYYGGDLRGITQKLPYLCSLGVTVLYLNPIFEAHSNHRYNTADYSKIDPLLGTEADFSELCETAATYGIRILLDGVFSHTGSDSVYFNRSGRYGSGGAYRDKSSPYSSWYTFLPDGRYKCWWGVDTLPETNEKDPAFTEFITGKEGVIRTRLRQGAAGFRLDVADELPDSFLDEVRKAAKAEKPDAFLLGEVWEDATNKISYGKRRRYLLGDQLDSVMNYPFSAAILTFLRYGVAETFMESVVTVCENYPKEALDCLMNHIGTHDTARILTRLASDTDTLPNGKPAPNVTPEALERAKLLLKTGAVLQYTLPGFPSVYYGDEAGMTGGNDPYNRAFYPWGCEDTAIISWYQKLGALRRSLSCLKKGSFRPYSAMLSCTAYIREDKNDSIFVIANLNPHAIDYYLPDEFKGKTELLTGKPVNGSVNVSAYGAAILKK